MPSPSSTELRRDRLHRLVTKALPHLAETVATGAWGKSGSPYRWLELADGRWRLTIEDAVSGERMGVVAVTKDAALDALEARLKA